MIVKGGKPATHVLVSGKEAPYPKYRKGSTGFAEMYIGFGEWGTTPWTNEQLDTVSIFEKLDIVK